MATSDRGAIKSLLETGIQGNNPSINENSYFIIENSKTFLNLTPLILNSFPNFTSYTFNSKSGNLNNQQNEKFKDT